MTINIVQEFERRIPPWLYTFAAFTVFRFVAWVFISIVNDQIFFYNITMLMLWGCFTALNVYGWVLVYSLYLELSDLSKLEDLAHLRVSILVMLIVVMVIDDKLLFWNFSSLLDEMNRSKVGKWLKTYQLFLVLVFE